MASQITIITGTGSASCSISTGGRGPRGLTGATGPQGAAGAAGLTGPQGPTGATGSDATVTAASVLAAIGEDPEASRNALEITPASIGATSLKNWVFEGDSWTAGTAQGNDRETWPYYLMRFLSVRENVSGYNVAIAGTTAATMASTFATQVTPYLTATTGKPSTAFIFAGINDISTNDATAVAALRTSLRSLWTDARNAGAKVCAFTLPHRTAGGGWTQANWKSINDNIIADASYYDYLIRTDIIFPNALSPELVGDGLHATTAAHAKFASMILGILDGNTAYPSIPSDAVFSETPNTALSSGARKNLGFSHIYDAGYDRSLATIGGNANTIVFTCPVDGTYEIKFSGCLTGLAAGDTAYINAWITPLATGTEVEHRLDYQTAGGSVITLQGEKRRRLLRGDKINLAVVSSKTNSAFLPNGNNSEFSVRLVSIP